jgi:hypothetical protein
MDTQALTTSIGLGALGTCEVEEVEGDRIPQLWTSEATCRRPASLRVAQDVHVSVAFVTLSSLRLARVLVCPHDC